MLENVSYEVDLKHLDSTKRRKASISSTLFRLILGVYFFIACATTIVQLYLEYHHEKDGIGIEISEIVGIVGPVLGKSIWDLDETAIESSINALLDKESIIGITLITDVDAISRGTTIDTATDSDDRPGIEIYQYSYPIHYTNELLEKKEIAQLHVFSNSIIVFERSKHILYSTLANAVIRTIFLTFIFFFMIRKIVEKPLNTLADIIDQYNLDNESTKYLPKEIVKRDDEIGLIAKKLIKMEYTIRSYQDRILDQQKGLEGQVDKKTKQLQYLASHDTLTGLLNRREFESKLSSLIDSYSTNSNHTLCFIDFDHFKTVNDTCGHAAGDATLV